MYNYILGSVVEIDTNYIVIDNNGIGYNVYVANPYIYREGEQYKVYTYQHITEYDHTLHGFSSRYEKELFLRLINVKGLGPKVALPMFAGSSVEGIIDAIDRENVIYLTKFPKVGEKLARQIILDLKGKLAPKEDNGLSVSNEVVEALTSLGYKNNDIKRALASVDANATIEEQIKQALKAM